MNVYPESNNKRSIYLDHGYALAIYNSRREVQLICYYYLTVVYIQLDVLDGSEIMEIDKYNK
jgi:hypothetical protein